MTEQVRLCAVWLMENWHGYSLNHIQGWVTVWGGCCHALEKGCLTPPFPSLRSCSSSQIRFIVRALQKKEIPNNLWRSRSGDWLHGVPLKPHCKTYGSTSTKIRVGNFQGGAPGVHLPNEIILLIWVVICFSLHCQFKDSHATWIKCCWDTG